jgi:hypothetical protein
MALKRRISKEAYGKLSDELKAEYKKDGDEFLLETEGDEDTGALKRARDREKQRADELKTSLEAAEAERDELKASRSNKDRDVDRLTKAHDAKLKELADAHIAAVTRKDKALEKLSVDNLAAEMARSISTAPKVILPHIRSRLMADLSGDEPAVKVLGADGKPSDMTVEKLKEEFLANKDFSSIIIASRASGGSAPRQGSTTGGAGSPQKPPSLAGLSTADLTAAIKNQIEADQR